MQHQWSIINHNIYVKEKKRKWDNTDKHLPRQGQRQRLQHFLFILCLDFQSINARTRKWLWTVTWPWSRRCVSKSAPALLIIMAESWCSHQKLFTLVSLMNFICMWKSSEKLSIRKTHGKKITIPFMKYFHMLLN